jgi:hypothetical protein
VTDPRSLDLDVRHGVVDPPQVDLPRGIVPTLAGRSAL